VGDQAGEGISPCSIFFVTDEWKRVATAKAEKQHAASIPEETQPPSDAFIPSKRLNSQVAERLKPDPWDGFIPAVVEYMKANLKDYHSSEWVEWSPVAKTPDGYMVRCKY
jgi:hypothetical protein